MLLISTASLEFASGDGSCFDFSSISFVVASDSPSPSLLRASWGSSTARPVSSGRSSFAVAASLGLLVTTALWFYSNQEEEAKRTAIIANLEDDSTGTRLEAVYEFSDAYKKEDQQIIDVLIDLWEAEGLDA